jgi:hypothetical protein
MMREINVDFISVKSKYELSVQQKLDDLEARDLVSRVGGSIYKINNAGQELINSYELQNKQVEEVGPSNEELKLEILQRMADYWDGNEYQLLSQDDVITNAVKHEFDIPSNKYFGLVVKLLGEGLVEKDPSGLTDSVSLTMEGYDKSQGFFEVNLNEEEKEISAPAQTQLTDLQISILQAVLETSEQEGRDGFVSIFLIWPNISAMMPLNYDVYTQNVTTPSLQKDLSYLYLVGYLEFTSIGGKVDAPNYRYRLSQKGKDLVDGLGKKPPILNKGLTKLQDAILRLCQLTPKYYSFEALKQELPGGVDPNQILNDLMDLEKINLVVVKSLDNIQITQQGIDYLTQQSQTIPTPPTTTTNLRPSPTDSATMYPTGRIKVGNDANLWKVTENKNGVKRWVKVGDTPSELPDPTNLDLGTLTFNKTGQSYRVSLVKGNKKEWVEVDSIANPTPVETPISEIDEDEVDLDILEQQLNDDSLEFDISDEDLDNLEF